MKLIDKVYGKQEIKDKLALDIIKTKEMQRLKGVNQYGALKFVTPWMVTTRFEHCLGVYFLLRKLGASREEQIAGLIHDIGHTAFSHVYDYVVGRHEEQDSNDEAQAGIVINSEINGFLLKEGIDTSFILDNKNFFLLDKELPDLCADRVDYILRDSLNYGLISKEETFSFVDSLRTDGKTIFLSKVRDAIRLTLILMKMDEEYYRSPVQNAVYSLCAEAMKIALNNNIIVYEDFFKTDDFLLNKLLSSKNKEVIMRMKLINPRIKVQEDHHNYDFFIKAKCRYIDPFVSEGGKITRVSEIDNEIKRITTDFRKKQEKGRYIKISWS
ncbi:MAG: HD domain-containing protein [Nanoarchaeota archaeon]|nr:HD domain-containing protein [Nanoarchaeota archaeon]